MPDANTPKRPWHNRADMARSCSVDYEPAVEPFLKTDRLSDSERAMLMGGARAKAYGLSLRIG